MRVVVVGAGLGGLAAAIAVHRAGHEVLVCERAPQLRETGAGIGLAPNGVLALDRLGVGTQVRAQASPQQSPAGLRDRTGQLLLRVRAEQMEAALGAPAVVVARRWLHRLLAEQLPATVLRTGTDVHDLRLDGPRVRLRTSTDELTADLVVAADGIGSLLRARLHPQHPGLVNLREYATRALVVIPQHLTGDQLPVGELLDRRNGERFGCWPVAQLDENDPEPGAGPYAYWYDTSRVRPPASGTRDWLAHRRRDWHPAVAELIMAARPDGVHVDAMVKLAKPLPTLVGDRVLLLGDAAHAMTPDLGQGGCQAFEDAVTLGAVLSGARPAGLVAALHRYDSLRQPRTASMIGASSRMNRLLTLTGPPARLRDLVLRGAPAGLLTRATIGQLRPRPDHIGGRSS